MPNITVKLCPYCGIQIDKEYKGAFKCPSCKQKIYLLNTDRGVKYLTKEEKEYEMRIQQEENQYYYIFEILGLSRKHLEKRKTGWFNEFKDQANYHDLIWSVFNELLNKYGKSQDWQSLKMVYYEMALYEYRQGGTYFHLLQESAKMELLNYKETGIVKKVEISCLGGCEACQKLNGKILTLEKALNTLPVPNKDCTYQMGNERGFCRCVYLSVID